MKTIVLPALVLSLMASLPLSVAGNPVEDFVAADIRFDIPQKEVIPGIAAVRASCDVIASGEPLTVLANRTVRSTLAVAAGPCSIIVTLGGVDVGLPIFNGTPLGTSSFYLPGISTLTLGFADLSVDLVTSLNSSSNVEDGPAVVSPRDIAWTSWSAERIRIQAEDGFGSMVETSLNTTFTYRMSLALSVYAFSVRLYHVDFAEIGSAVGSPSLRTNLSVDLRPHPLVLDAAEDITHGGATISWSGDVDADVSHLELWLAEDASTVSVRLAPGAVRTDVLLRPSTSYRAWIVAVDAAGQATPSNEIAFMSAAAPADNGLGPVGASGAEGLTWVVVTVAILVGVLGYAVGFLRGRKGD
jgi:hypothetical protein